MRVFEGIDTRSGISVRFYYNDTYPSSTSSNNNYDLDIRANDKTIISRKYSPTDDVGIHLKKIHDEYLCKKQVIGQWDEKIIADKAAVKVLRLIIKNATAAEIYQLLCANYHGGLFAGARDLKEKFKALMK